ncbi:RidA family protein [Candidatus Obscuribacterales bacterium]|jgi:2-iminobutanoate/2-iminopropanoate deaminase|nr:RidA family protein [Candidatus Obscuribacterales bacterium]MBX3152864.1 RidA family protein [Candidatus Obscuribacterales bacterium]
MLQAIQTDKAPKAIGPYSQAVKANGFVFVSGQIPIDPATSQLAQGSVAELTKQVMRNLTNIIETAGSSLDNVVKTTIYLKDMSDFEEVNAAYAEFFPNHKPARATVEVARLPKDVKVEIDAIAVCP